MIFYFTDSNKTSNLNQVLKNLPKNCNIIFRYYDKTNIEKQQILKNIISSNLIKRSSVFIGKNPYLAYDFRIKNIHFSDYDFNKSNKSFFLESYKLKKIGCKISLSIHSLMSLKLARIMQPNFIFLSPIFPTSTHNSAYNIGFFNFIKYKKIAETKFNIDNILPLGGINLQNLSRLNKVNIKGFGAIDFFNNL